MNCDQEKVFFVNSDETLLLLSI